MSLRRTIKEPFKYLVFLLLAQIGRWISASGVPILTYHSLDESGSPISVAHSEFRKQMHYLKDHGFTTVSLLDYVRSLEAKKPVSKKAFVLTFDDGFKTVYQNAFPILDELGFTATVFLVTEYVGQRASWQTGEEIRKTGANHFSLLSWEEVGEMYRHGFGFGSHGAHHMHLTQVDSALVNEDVEKSKHIMEDKLGEPCLLFCYPYGEFNEPVRRIIQENGFEGAVTIEFGRNDKNTDPYALRRIGSAHFTNKQVFKACIYGTYGWHLHRKGKSRFPQAEGKGRPPPERQRRRRHQHRTFRTDKELRSQSY